MPDESTSFNAKRFNLISWIATGVIVALLAGIAIWRLLPAQLDLPVDITPTEEPGGMTSLPSLDGGGGKSLAIIRRVALETAIEESVRYEVVEYTVERGDTVSSIAASYGIESSTLMWANEELMLNGPNSLRVGQVLLVPPVDGVLYQWEEGDSLVAVADTFEVTSDDILLWPGNEIDLADPVIETGAFVMVPGGKSDAILYVSVVYASGTSGTSTGRASSCGDAGPVGGGGALLYPSPYHYILGGNPYSGSHLAIDLYAPEGTPITAADSGVVIWSSYGEWNGGYGSVVMIDHRNGYSTLYGHLSQVNVVLCQAVYAGEVIGLSGNTGNSFGAHLHFEVRLGGGFLNPWDFLPPP